MRRSDLEERQMCAAVIAGSIVMFSVGVMYRVLAGDTWHRKSFTPINSESLRRLPLQIADWIGEEVAIDERVIQATGGDLHINRRYTRDGGRESVVLYIVVGTNAAEIMSHRPLGCYRAAGWTLIECHPLRIQSENGIAIQSLLYQFYRDGLATEKITVVHYCRADGQYFDEVMKVLAVGWRGLRSISYAAQVQIIASSQTLTDDAATRMVTDFALESAAPIGGLFEDIETDGSLHGSRESRSPKSGT